MRCRSRFRHNHNEAISAVSPDGHHRCTRSQDTVALLKGYRADRLGGQVRLSEEGDYRV